MSPKHKQRRVVGYVRISRKRDEQSSTENQEHSIRAYCDAHGWMLVDVVVEEGRSAFKADRGERPGFKKALGMIQGGAADTFVVWKLDRAARDTLDLLKFVREDLKKHNADFVSVTESFDTTTPMGRAMLTIVAALAEMESAQKSERTLEWHEGRRRKGLVPTGRTALGYTKVGGTLELDPVVAPLIQEAADRLLDGQSMQSIWKWIKGEGVDISRPGLLTSLQSPTMAGLVCNEPLVIRSGQRIVPDTAELIEGDWTPILDREKWDQVRLILRDPSRRTFLSNKLAHPLRPIIRCVCGGVMVVSPDRRRNKGNRYTCKECRNGITQSPIDEAVTAAVLARLDDGAWRSLRAGQAASGPDPVLVEERLAKMWQGVLAGTFDQDEYAEAKMAWRGQLAASAPDPNSLPDVESVRDSWDTLGVMERHLVFRRVIDSLVIGKSVKVGRFVDMSRVSLKLIP